jgi:hypothetical protein
MTVFERISRLALAATTGLLVVLVLADGAQAGRFHVYSCRTPSGQLVPAEGWSGVVATGSTFATYAENTCKSGGALVAALGEATTHNPDVDRATWTFVSPAATSLTAATLWRAGYLHGPSGESTSYRFWLAGPKGGFETCVYTEGCSRQGEIATPFSEINPVSVPTVAIGSPLSISVACSFRSPGARCATGFHDPNSYAAVVYLFAADLTLEQTAGPSAGGVSGELASAPAVSGTSDVAFTATDPGAGVYQAMISVDGQVVQRTGLDENGGKCRDVGETSDGLPAFLSPQPCERSLSADVGFDTTRVSNGAHHLIVSVTDAAGNAVAALDRTVTVANPLAPGTPGPPNGANASSQAALTVAWKGSRRERLTVGYGHAETVAGQLTTSDRAPIAGAQIEVLTTPSFAGGKPKLTSLLTGPDGRFAVRVPAGTSSRTLHFMYRSHHGDALPAVTRTLTLGVRAGIALTIAPRTASVERSIFFHGRLRGGPVPHEGKQLVLEARSPGGRWIEFDVVRTDSRGRYRASYRFKFPGPADYQFRVRSEPESDYPFLAGTSRVIGVHES